MRQKLLVIFLLWLGTKAAIAVEQKKIFLGFLERNPTQVRIVFVNKDGRWEPIRSLGAKGASVNEVMAKVPAEMFWTIAFDGRSFGAVKSRSLENYANEADLGLQKVDDSEKLPVVGKSSSTFASWMNNSAGQQTVRPLVLVSAPNTSDKTHWRPAKPTEDAISRVRAAYHERYPKPIVCDPKGNQVGMTYAPSEITVDDSYGNSNGELLFSVHLEDPKTDTCEGEAGGFNDDYSPNPFASQWFHVAKGKKPLWLSGTGKLKVVDAGDYDADGISEIVFKLASYNLDGYFLWKPTMAEPLKVSWHYH